MSTFMRSQRQRLLTWRGVGGCVRARATQLGRRFCASVLGLLLLITAGFGSGWAEDALGLDDGRSRGDKQAPIVLIEYSDFTCGFCKKFFLETWPRIQAKYVETGKVRFLYRDYPRADRGPGLEAAIAARCAGDQGQYWAMHDRLFGGHARFGDAIIGRHARAIGLDLTAFAKCRQERPHRSAIFEDRAQGAQWGFRGTPGFVLLRMENGRADMVRHTPITIPGAFPYEVFEEQIERLLAGAPS